MRNKIIILIMAIGSSTVSHSTIKIDSLKTIDIDSCLSVELRHKLEPIFRNSINKETWTLLNEAIRKDVNNVDLRIVRSLLASAGGASQSFQSYLSKNPPRGSSIGSKFDYGCAALFDIQTSKPLTPGMASDLDLDKETFVSEASKGVLLPISVGISTPLLNVVMADFCLRWGNGALARKLLRKSQTELPNLWQLELLNAQSMLLGTLKRPKTVTPGIAAWDPVTKRYIIDENRIKNPQKALDILRGIQRNGHHIPCMSLIQAQAYRFMSMNDKALASLRDYSQKPDSGMLGSIRLEHVKTMITSLSKSTH